MAPKRKADYLESDVKRMKLDEAEALSGPKPANPLACLLGLPRELRDIIYEHTLVETTVHVTTALKEPPLLSTCRQIRQEARKMFFADNKCQIDIVDCDATFFSKLQKHHGRVGRKLRMAHRPEIIYTLAGIESWKNLLEWASRVCSGEKIHLTPYRGDQVPFSTYESVVLAVLNVAKGFRKSGGSWKVCEKAIAMMRPMAGNVNQGWLRDDW